jgi:Ca2+-binding EF-hand superfamily protein
MTRSKKYMLAAAGASLLGLAAMAGIAQADRGSHDRGWGHGFGGHGGMMQQFTERYDANQDGRISQEEIDTNRTATHGQYDADKDGILNLAEFEKLWLEMNRQRLVREFQRFDADGDAKVTLDEYKKPLQDMVARADHNNDGFLSRDDRRERRGMMHRWMRGGGEGSGQGPGPQGMPGDGAPDGGEQ